MRVPPRPPKSTDKRVYISEIGWTTLIEAYIGDHVITGTVDGVKTWFPLRNVLMIDEGC